MPVDLEGVVTNFVQVDVAALGLTTEEAVARLRDEGVALSPTAGGRLRAVTHLDIDDDDVERALDAVPRALGVLAHA